MDRREEPKDGLSPLVGPEDEPYTLPIQEPDEPTPDGKHALKFELFDWAQALLSAIILVAFVFIFFVRVIGVSGHSMEPTLFENQKLLISNLFYTPKNGDIVIFTKKDIHVILQTGQSDEPLVKRVIATAGQTVDVNYETRQVLIDGQPIQEPYVMDPISIPSYSLFPLPYTVQPGEVFVMGDNRNHSADSRMIGPIDTRYILGKVLLRVWPVSLIGSVE